MIIMVIVDEGRLEHCMFQNHLVTFVLLFVNVWYYYYAKTSCYFHFFSQKQLFHEYCESGQKF
jgi:hypothetical protein